MHLGGAIGVGCRLAELYLSHNKIKAEGAKYIAEALERDKCLTVLSIGNGSLDKSERKQRDRKRGRGELRDSDGGLRETETNQHEFVPPTIFSVESNGISEEGAKSLAEGAGKCTFLEELNLGISGGMHHSWVGGNPIKDIGASFVARAVEGLRSLSKLKLSKCDIGQISCSIIRRRLQIGHRGHACGCQERVHQDIKDE